MNTTTTDMRARSAISVTAITEYEVTLDRWIFNREGSDFRVATGTDFSGATHKVAGTLGHCDLGKTYRLSARLENNKYGPTLKVVSAVAIQPRSHDAVISYLETLPGIGETSARALVSAYGPELAIDSIEKDSLESIREKAGIRISAEKLVELRLYLEAERSSREVDLQIRKLLGDLATDKLVKKILDLWGDSAPTRIARDPWSLTELPQIGFLRADQVAQRLGVDPQSPSRVRAALDHVIEEMRGSGHTRHRSVTVCDRMCEVLGFRTDDGCELVVGGIAAAIETGEIVDLSLRGVGDFIATRFDDDTEQEIARRLLERVTRKPLAFAPELVTEVGGLHPDQDAALQQMTAQGMGGTCLLTGPPGCGKTTMVRAFFGRFASHRIALCAPTGKAAKRLAQQAGMPASTIHRLLEPMPSETTDGKVQFGFTRDASNQIDKDLVVVDEASMVDAALFRSLLRAIPQSCYLLIVGDPHQLSSVSPGCVLRDLIESAKVPHAQLVTIKRTNPGRLLSTIHRVKDGRWQSFPNEKDSDLFHVPAATEADCVASIASLYLDRLPKIAPAGDDPIQSIQVLVPWRTKEGLSARVVNEEIQRRRIAAGAVTMEGKFPFGRGDKVIQLKNDAGLGIVNGDQGVVLAVEHRPVSENAAPSWCYVVQFDGYKDPVVVSAIANELDLSYAVTVHKSQGSEWPIIVLPTINTQSPFYDRTLFYTALSRASKACVLVGRLDGLQRVVDRITAERRETSLSGMLRG